MGRIVKRDKYYSIVYDEPRGKDGERHQVMKSIRALGGSGTNYKEAQTYLAEIERKIRIGEYTNSDHTVESFAKEWLDFARPTLAASTGNMYAYVLKAHILPEIGTVKLAELAPMKIQRLYKRLQEDTYRSPLSGKSVRNVHALLHKLCDQAVKWGVLASNPADRVTLPKVDKPTVQAVCTADLSRLLDAFDNAGVYRVPMLIAAYTGMRRGEVLGLRWGDYDTKAHTLAVCRALSQYTWEITVKGTKTDRARVIMLPAALVDVLDVQAMTTDHHEAGDYICGDSAGKPLCPKEFSKQFTAIAKTLELPITLHGLRHTQATLLLAAGVPVKVVAERLGHSRVATTLDVYAHVLPAMQQQAVDVLDKLQASEQKVSNADLTG